MKNYYILPTLLVLLTTVISCTKPCTECKEINGNATLYLNISGGDTKSDITTTQEGDNTINSLDVFIFRNTEPSSPDYQKLDTYKHFTSSGLNQLSINTTTGPKTICVVANDHSNTFEGVTNLTEFRDLLTSLTDEQLSSFTMYGETSETLGTTSTVTLSLVRFISRITLTSFRTNFSGTPYSGMSISNLKLYLVNAQSENKLYNGAPSTNPPKTLNKGKLVGNDANSTAGINFIYEPITGTFDDSGYNTPHYFYCYSNETTDLTTCTKLVLQCDLDGVTYYYPLPVNQENYAHLPTNGHYGVRRNHTYSYSITITRPGSLDPNTPIIPGTLDLSINVSDWVVVPHFHKEF